jgi:hypothetical protein
MPSKQATFNKVYRFLVAQGRPSVNKATEKCLYRHQLRNGKVLKCAVGCLIPDRLYTPRMEGKTWGQINNMFPQVVAKLSLPSHFYIELQQVHDDWATHNSLRTFKDKMRSLALRNDLDPSIVK